MRRQQSFTVKAAAGAPATAAVPVEAECLDAPRGFGSGVDISTYRYLDELWAAALLQAEASVLALPHTGSSGLQGAKHTSEADNAGRKETSIKQAADKTGVSSTCNESLLTLSPLPRAPVLPSGSAAHSPVPQPPPPVVVARRSMPSATSKQTWMRVEAQPNLKRNAYTARRGVAWVVQ
ncbi:hypothetical protein CGC21_34925 [Leishmania donovani]|uniref:Uncharacterized protein n=1 Tax=Leishmania donovani TaxID=5661 RepID=A0A3S7X348_LEIDO|nr:hypothetical protein LdCL_300007200 [Leishmania donovani]TPP45594.1 hypothetical protein CGC21_34925 [Leishmania donovani]